MSSAENTDISLELESVLVGYPGDGVAILTIASEPLGVLRFGVKRALLYHLHELEGNTDIRCLIITGSDKAFSVGSDIRDFSTEVGWLLENEFVEAGLNAAIEQSRLPVIAAINGHALGGGAVLALACDIRMAARSATFGFPEVTVGAFASGSGTQRLPRIVGRSRALDLLLTGRRLEANEALEYGLVDFLVADSELQQAALEKAKTIAANSAPAVTASKRCVVGGLRSGFEHGLALERRLRVLTGRGADAREGRQAFLEKRSPKFSEAWSND